MKRVGAVLLVWFAVVAAAWAGKPGPAVTNDLPGGSKVLYAVPSSGWSGDLLVFTHGYQPPTEAPAFANLSFAGVYLPEVSQTLGFAFAAPAYRMSGLAVQTGADDVRQAVERFARYAGRKPRRTFIVGASEGALIAVQALERYPDLFTGGVAMCGPIGDFKVQSDYVCTFRAIFDCCYPGLIPGSVTNVPDEVRANWYTQYEPLLRAAVEADPARALELLRVAKAAYDPADGATLAETVQGVMWYHAFGAEDVMEKLHGNPFGNTYARYRGAADNAALNAAIERCRADPVTRLTIKSCQTTGRMLRPLVLMHTTLDEIVPYAHAPLYLRKANAMKSAQQVKLLTIERYGHCNFAFSEVLDAIALLLSETRPVPAR